MAELPKNLEDAIEQAKTATQAALDAGVCRIQVELNFPELKPMPIAEQFLSIFEDLGANFKVFFPDAGAAALARRDWGEKPFEIRGIGELKGKMLPEDQAFLMVAPTSVEVAEVQKMADEARERPFVLLNPVLEDIATVGLGYAGRQLRTRFLSTFEVCYYLRPLENGALLRCYPGPWQVWLELEDDYKLIAEVDTKPAGDEIDRILAQSTGNPEDPTPAPKTGFMTELQRFLRALTQ
ncbi:DUF1995 family protein [Trichocoleus sp. FACHB-591]|uniref:DUF1995 family protein n=1 Tax=Trichocoleus sp. FACHB-591 TaxID=2692872 RepID=UPI00168695A1|nr:DUF1995 family protein [Trichocoleus sp. FACHB-591]MBD2097987.1 DUF1995 family protein [Trichocoleus sp. FACHB-591]